MAFRGEVSPTENIATGDRRDVAFMAMIEVPNAPEAVAVRWSAWVCMRTSCRPVVGCPAELRVCVYPRLVKATSTLVRHSSDTAGGSRVPLEFSE